MGFSNKQVGIITVDIVSLGILRTSSRTSRVLTVERDGPRFDP
jgi:hypothetical protein